ncbi:hypothetical protein [Pseudomonas sp. RA_15y_Pfl2_54]|uniref:hypothetical protein n=1 Tax=Pseudomonas sp. RA_15y_Pfl2_54 TaxID=3088704 RepID=UPI0030DB346D
MIPTQSNSLLSGDLLAASQAMAGDLRLWQTNSLSDLYGKNFGQKIEFLLAMTYEYGEGALLR